VLAVRGYVKIVGLPSNRKPQENVLFYSHVLPLARPEEKKQVIAGLGNAEVLESFRVVAPLLAEEAVKNEAAAALLKIGRAIEGANRDEVAVVARKVLETIKDENIRKQAQAVIDRQNTEGFIKDWLVSGPYTSDSQDLFNTAFGPEKGEAGVKWKKLVANPNKERAWEANLNAMDFKGDNRVAYLRCGITSPKEQEVQLEVGSDDGVKVWLNGKLVHENNVSRANEAGQDKLKVTLRQGLNVLVLKVVNGGADWGASARFRTVEGKRLEGLKIKAEAEDATKVKYPVL
jgi:hypothetical protein